MNKNDLIEFCRIYKGEDTNPYEGGNQALFWEYEKSWVHHYLSGQHFTEEISEYVGNGLAMFSLHDGVPMSLKALLFNRYARTAYAMIYAVEPFKEFYTNEYLTTNPLM